MKVKHVVIATATAAVLACVVPAMRLANILRSEEACNLAWDCWEAGDSDGALQWCNESIRLDARCSPPYSLRARIFQSRGELEKAAKDRIRIGDLQGETKFCGNYIAAAKLHEELGDINAAGGLYSRAILAHATNIGQLEIIANDRAGNSEAEPVARLRDFIAKAATRKPEDQQLQRAWSVLRDAAIRCRPGTRREDRGEASEEPEEE